MGRKKPTLQAELFVEPLQLDRGVCTTPEIDRLIAAHAPIALGVSGGKDSCLLGFAVTKHLDEIGHRGPRILVHADLGRVEWRDSLPTCQRLADRLGLELVVVRREAGDMMDRWIQRWHDNVERYRALSCVRLIGPWSSSSARFCTSEMKVGPICRELTRRFPGTTIINAVGIRRQESKGREQAPIAKVQPGLRRVRLQTRGLNWNPILHYLRREVFGRLELEGFQVHRGYGLGMKRISCGQCVLADEKDLRISVAQPEHRQLYLEEVDLEIASGFSFQEKRWLADLAPDLLSPDQIRELRNSKHCAEVRREQEARIPEHLLFEEGWPKVMPTPAEAELLADVRLRVAVAVGIDGVRCLTRETVLARYKELIQQREAREAAAP